LPNLNQIQNEENSFWNIVLLLSKGIARGSGARALPIKMLPRIAMKN